MFEAESSGTEETVGTDGNLEFEDPLPAMCTYIYMVIHYIAWGHMKLP